MRRFTRLAPVLLAGALLATGCGGETSETENPPTTGGATGAATTPAAATLKVGLAYDIGGRGDKSFNDAAAAGLDKAEQAIGIEPKELEAASGESDADKESRLRLLAQQDFNPIIAVGFAYATALGKVAPEFPDTKFAIVDDGSVEGDNVANLIFAEEQGSFLVGAAAGLKTKTNKVGFVGGVETPLIQKFEAGFDAGVKQTNPEAEVVVQYLTQAPDFTGFTDPAKGKAAAEGMYDADADIVYHAAGGSGTGVFEAAKAADALAIGVDSDQYETVDASLQDVIMTSMLKKVDVAVFDFISSVSEDTFTAGPSIYDLARDGVGYSTSGGKIDDIVPQLEELKQQIISGEISVPDAP